MKTLLFAAVLVFVGAPVCAQTSITTDGVIESTAGGFKFPDGTVQSTAAPKYIGEFCWLIGDPADPEASLALLRLGITSEGDGHHSVNGLVTERDPGEEFEPDGPITGNMEIIGGESIMTLTVSTVDGFPPEESLLIYTVVHLRLDGVTLDGTAYGITTAYNLTNEAFEPMEAGSEVIEFLPDCVVP